MKILLEVDTSMTRKEAEAFFDRCLGRINWSVESDPEPLQGEINLSGPDPTDLWDMTELAIQEGHLDTICRMLRIEHRTVRSWAKKRPEYNGGYRQSMASYAVDSLLDRSRLTEDWEEYRLRVCGLISAYSKSYVSEKLGVSSSMINKYAKGEATPRGHIQDGINMWWEQQS